MLKFKSLAQDCLIALVIVLAALLLMLGLDPWLEMTQTPFLLFFGAVPMAALYLGRRGGIIATVLSALFAYYFFITSPNSFSPNVVGVGRTLIFIAEGILLSILISGGQFPAALRRKMQR
ncbi:MAG: DUF4118 domain-containing protein, partial [Oscillatoriales cyanobacterium C42_A2020_001]|nr:DUF4118 domain-containing protein [Leptolyngbyaceae cyanobacterium C42_A2020_001]